MATPPDQHKHPPVLLDEYALARHLCVVIEGLDDPGPRQIQRWRACIRTWASRYPDQVRRYGSSRRHGRRYDLQEVLPLARRWLKAHPTHPAREVVTRPDDGR